MILNNENTFLGGLMADLKEIAVTFACVVLLTAFLAMLIAPALEPILCYNLRRKACGGIDAPTEEDILRARRQITIVKIGLWVCAILAWTLVFILNNVWNLYGY